MCLSLNISWIKYLLLYYSCFATTCKVLIEGLFVCFIDGETQWFNNISCACCLLCGDDEEIKVPYYFTFRALKIWNIIKSLIKAEIQTPKVELEVQVLGSKT